MAAYYNEIDPFAAQWLRNLIAAGHIAPGDVDERSIVDVRADDLRGYQQCHFFAGIGVWSHALRLAGWDDKREVWTGSCPCQPFSAAGKGDGFADERHLWPSWHWLIEQCRPVTIFGEQVEAAIKRDWLDLVQSDLEGIGYTVRPVGFPAASVGAPNIRQRLYFVADADLQRCERRHSSAGLEAWSGTRLTGSRESGELANAAARGLGIDGGAPGQRGHAAQCDTACLVADAERDRQQARCRDERCAACARREHRDDTERCGVVGDAFQSRLEGYGRHGHDRREPGRLDAIEDGPTTSAGAARDFWGDAEWIACRDGKARAIEPGTFPLAYGASARVGRLRAYGNAINARQAAAFIGARMDINA